MGALTKTQGSVLKEEKVYSPVNDVDIKKHLKESHIWKLCYKSEELTKDVLKKHTVMYEYTVKFDGLTPVQVTNVKSL